MVWVAGFKPAASPFQAEYSYQAELHPVIDGVSKMIRTSDRAIIDRELYQLSYRDNNMATLTRFELVTFG
jgi:hypothetical protein